MEKLKILNGDTLRIIMPIDNSMIASACKSIKKHKLTKLNISNEHLHGAFDSLNFLKDFSEVAATIVEVNLFGSFTDFDNLYLFHNIKELFCEIKNDEKIDLSRFEKIKTLTTSRIESYTNLSLSQLKELCFYGMDEDKYTNGKLDPDMLSQLHHLSGLRLLCNVKDFSFEEVNGLDNLQYVIINQCNIKNFNGIEKFTNLQSIDAAYCYSLNDISAIKALPNLVWLELGPCPRIKSLDDVAYNNVLRGLSLISFKEVDVEIIRTLKELRFLFLEKCKPVPSIRFIQDLKKLVGLTFIGTKIIDGDLTPAMRLKNASITDMRHYNIKSDQLPSNGKYAYPCMSQIHNLLNC